MLKIIVPATQFWNEKEKKFVYSKESVLNLEHSLISISKWEARYHKPFFSKEKKTESEVRYYIKCMTINTITDDKVYWALTADNFTDIDKYIHDPMTATTFSNKKKKTKSKSKKTNDKREMTSEYIYYLMIQYGIPHEYEKWHIERLIALIKLCDEENSKNDPENKKKKQNSRTTNEQLDRMAALNERRKAGLHTRG